METSLSCKSKLTRIPSRSCAEYECTSFPLSLLLYLVHRKMKNWFFITMCSSSPHVKKHIPTNLPSLRPSNLSYIHLFAIRSSCICVILHFFFLFYCEKHQKNSYNRLKWFKYNLRMISNSMYLHRCWFQPFAAKYRKQMLVI